MCLVQICNAERESLSDRLRVHSRLKELHTPTCQLLTMWIILGSRVRAAAYAAAVAEYLILLIHADAMNVGVGTRVALRSISSYPYSMVL